MTTAHETDSQGCSSCSGACRSTAVDRHETHRPLSIDGAQPVSPLRRSTDWPSIDKGEGDPKKLAEMASATYGQDTSTAELCCGRFTTCEKSCTPRGAYLQAKGLPLHQAPPDGVISAIKPGEIMALLPGEAIQTPTRPRIYLAGPMTGLPSLNYPAFHAKAAELRAMGFDVVNPAELNPDQTKSWAECMRVDIPQLLTCQGIALMAGWNASKGGKLEHHIAEQLGMFIIYLNRA